MLTVAYVCVRARECLCVCTCNQEADTVATQCLRRARARVPFSISVHSIDRTRELADRRTLDMLTPSRALSRTRARVHALSSSLHQSCQRPQEYLLQRGASPLIENVTRPLSTTTNEATMSNCVCDSANEKSGTPDIT